MVNVFCSLHHRLDFLTKSMHREGIIILMYITCALYMMCYIYIYIYIYCSTRIYIYIDIYIYNIYNIYTCTASCVACNTWRTRLISSMDGLR